MYCYITILCNVLWCIAILLCYVLSCDVLLYYCIVQERTAAWLPGQGPGCARRVRGTVGGTVTVRGCWCVGRITVSHSLVRRREGEACMMERMTAALGGVHLTHLALMERFVVVVVFCCWMCCCFCFCSYCCSFCCYCYYFKFGRNWVSNSWDIFVVAVVFVLLLLLMPVCKVWSKLGHW